MEAIVPPQPFAIPSFIRKLDTPGGAVRLDSRFYVKRDHIDDRLYQEISKDRGTTTTIRGPRQVGKTSLLIRAEGEAQKVGHNTVYLDLQSVDSTYLSNMDTFLHYLATVIITELSLDLRQVEQAWKSPLGPPDKFNYLLKNYLLPTIEVPFLLVMDEVEQLLDGSFHDDFFGLVRGWHNLRARNPLWDKLHTIMVISTEPHLLIQNEMQSPFNVGLVLELTDFNKAQVSYLNEQYQSPLTPQAIDNLIQLLAGHPYLTQQALYTLVADNLTWSVLVNIAATDKGPFNPHLRRYLTLLKKHPPLAQAMWQVIQHHKCPDHLLFQRLFRAGLIQGSSQDCTCRCELYERYLKDRL